MDETAWSYIVGIPIIVLLMGYTIRILLTPPRARGVAHYRSGAYRREFARTRKIALARDRRRCVICGGAGRVHVHHKIARARGGSNDPSNLVTLCKRHHGQMHGRRF